METGSHKLVERGASGNHANKKRNGCHSLSTVWISEGTSQHFYKFEGLSSDKRY